VRKSLQGIFFKSILINHKITFTYDSVMKKHLHPCCPVFKQQGYNAPVISPASLKLLMMLLLCPLSQSRQYPRYEPRFRRPWVV